MNALLSSYLPVVIFIAVAMVVGLALIVAPFLLAEPLGRRLGIDVRIVGHLTLAIAGLVLVEQLFRNARPQSRWAIKYLCLGVGGLFAYDFFMYSDGLLFKRLDVNLWQARGLVDTLVVPLIAVAAARNPEWSLDVFVSRRVVFHGAAVLGAGIYLLVMAAGVRGRGRWLPRAVVQVVAVAMLGLALVNPDALIVRYNVAAAHDASLVAGLDVAYLQGLSADAVPEIDRLDEPLRSCVLQHVTIAAPEGLVDWNLGRDRAAHVTAAEASDASGPSTCADDADRSTT